MLMWTYPALFLVVPTQGVCGHSTGASTDSDVSIMRLIGFVINELDQVPNYTQPQRPLSSRIYKKPKSGALIFSFPFFPSLFSTMAIVLTGPPTSGTTFPILVVGFTVSVLCVLGVGMLLLNPEISSSSRFYLFVGTRMVHHYYTCEKKHALKLKVAVIQSLYYGDLRRLITLSLYRTI